MIDAHWFMDTYIARLSLIIYYHSLSYSLGHGANIVTSYCPFMTSDTMIALDCTIPGSQETYERRATLSLNKVAPERHFYQTIVQYDGTIVAP